MAKVLVKFTRSDGREFTLNDNHWKIPSDGLEGFGSFDNSISIIDNAVGDGGVIASHRVSQKDRTIKAVSRNTNLAEILRDEATSFFNPKMTYKVYLTYMGRTRWAEGRIEKFYLSTGNIYQPMTLTVTLLFADPYLKSYEDFGKDIASLSPLAGFPYLCTAAQGSPTGVFNFASAVNLSNDGDVEAYCKVVIAANGVVTNPKIIINGHYVRVLDVMQEGDVIIMDFAANPPTVRKNGVNYIGHCDRTSQFDQMGLVVGDSSLQYDADNGTNLLSVSVYYNKLYSAM
jgi:hypothetical protein